MHAPAKHSEMSCVCMQSLQEAFPHTPHYRDKIPMAGGVFNITSQAGSGNAVSACTTCPGAALRMLGRFWVNTAELKPLSKESKCLRHILVKSNQLQTALCRSSGRKKNWTLKSVNAMGYCQCLETRSVFGSFSLAMFWKCLFIFLFFFFSHLSLSTSIFLLFFGIKELPCLIMTVQPPHMVVKFSNTSEEFYYFSRVFFLYFHMPVLKILYIYSGYISMTIYQWL